MHTSREMIGCMGFSVLVEHWYNILRQLCTVFTEWNIATSSFFLNCFLHKQASRKDEFCCPHHHVVSNEVLSQSAKLQISPVLAFYSFEVYVLWSDLPHHIGQAADSTIFSCVCQCAFSRLCLVLSLTIITGSGLL